MKNKAVNAPKKFEEIVMIMINAVISRQNWGVIRHLLYYFCDCFSVKFLKRYLVSCFIASIHYLL